MSIGVLIGVHDGIVLGADSASTLTISSAPGALAGIANVYDNANKIFNVYKGKPIGCVTFGTGSIGNSSIGTLIKDLRYLLHHPAKALAAGITFNPERYQMEDVARMIAKFMGDECARQGAAMMSAINIGFLVGGYSSESSFGESWRVEIKAGVPVDPIKLRTSDQAGISWGGMGEAIQRLVLGYSGGLFQTLADVSGGQGTPKLTVQQVASQLTPIFTVKLQAPLVFAPMPIQDAIDLARFLVHASIEFSRFHPGPQVVGGPIELAAITKHEGFKWIGRKHYFEQNLNREPSHVVVDRSEQS